MIETEVAQQALRPLPANAWQQPLPWQTWQTTKTASGYVLEGVLPVLPVQKDTVALLQFARVGCKATVEIGTQRTTHYGGYTVWQVPLPETETARSVRLTLEDGNQQLNPYDKAGVFGEIVLAVLPKTHCLQYKAHTICTPEGWQLRVAYDTSLPTQAALSVWAQDNCVATAQSNTGSFALPCPAVTPWSEETPTLYEARLTVGQAEYRFMVGFRSILRAGKQVLWNNKPLRLKGLCYREPLPLEGADALQDIKLFAEAGVNYLRALYYPFSESVLAACDALGIYVEQSMPFHGVGIDIAPTQNMPHHRKHYLTQCSEVLRQSANHPCVLLWSLGSDSAWGQNFAACRAAVRQYDSERLLNFHAPMTISDSDELPDVFSAAYVDWRQPLDVCYDHMVVGHTHGADNEIGYATAQADYNLPVLHDAIAHIPCYNRDEIASDAAVREFWGESILRFYDKMQKTPGCLGIAVMAAVDEDGLFDERLQAMHRGILTAQRKQKPEYYHLQMAYTQGKRYQEIDTKALPHLTAQALHAQESETQLIVQNSAVRFVFSRKECLLAAAYVGNTQVLSKGPFLQATRVLLPQWVGHTLTWKPCQDGSMLVMLQGGYGDAATVRYRLVLQPDGKVEAEAEVRSWDLPTPHAVKAGIGLDPGGLNELGIAFDVPAALQTLQWQRKGLWNTYPAQHIGRNNGRCTKDIPTDFYSTKHHIFAAMITNAAGCGVGVVAQANRSLRLQRAPESACLINDTDAAIVYDGLWYQIEDACGNFKGTQTMSDAKGATATLHFYGTGIALYGPSHILHGLYHIELDGVETATQKSGCPLPVDFESFSRGAEKRYGQLLYQEKDLPLGQHTLVIKVCGEKVKKAQGCYVAIDYAERYTPELPPQTRMIVNTDFNYARLVRGNYMRPCVTVQRGTHCSCTLQLVESAGNLQW